MRRHAWREHDKTVLLARPVLADVPGSLADIEHYAGLGVTEILVTPSGHPVEFVTEVAEKVLPHVSSIW